MGDPLSIAAGIIAVVGVFAKSVKLALEFRGAPDEIRGLHLELEHIETVGKELRTLAGTRSFRSTNIQSLESCFVKLQHAQKVFDTEVLGKQDAGGYKVRFSRRIWVLRRGKLKKLGNELSILRKDLTESMLILNISTTLAIRDFICLSQDERIFQTQQQQLTYYPGSTKHCNIPKTPLVAQEEPDNDAVSMLSMDDSDTASFYTPRTSFLDCTLETFSTFYPEQYVMENRYDKRLIIFSTTTSTIDRLIYFDKYTCLFARDARHWKRVTVTSVSTVWREVATLQASPYGRKNTRARISQDELMSILDRSYLFDSVTNVQLCLSKRKTGSGFGTEISHVLEDTLTAASLDITKYLDDIRCLGIPYYVEQEVAWLECIEANAHLVMARSKLCIERKLPFDQPNPISKGSVEEFVEDLERLKKIQGIQHVAKLIGVVLTDDQKRICSYLVEFPGGRHLFRVLESAEQQGLDVTWQRIENWIRQAIQTTAAIHEAEVVIGQISNGRFWIDSKDNLVVMPFTAARRKLPRGNGCMPPELRTSTVRFPTTSELTIQSDLFQLGICIWMLAERVTNLSAALCPKSGCPISPFYGCVADHTNPVELPRCGIGVPDYINKIISHCRKQDPHQRKSASSLLKMLPPEANVSELTPIVASLNKFDFWVDCDECGGLATEAHYHCEVCHVGDFDLCISCYNCGSRCPGPDHELYRREFSTYVKKYTTLE